jgi:peptide deformylase
MTMTIRKIARLGHPVLREEAKPLLPSEITSPEIQLLIQDMFDTVHDAEGRGLTAPQVHISKQIVILDLEDEQGFKVWINPIIEPLTDEYMITFEGCLSIPGMRGAVARPSKIKVKTLNEKGILIEMILEGDPAIVAQHECDHLKGILYVDRVEAGTLCFLEEYYRYAHLYLDQFSEEVN